MTTTQRSIDWFQTLKLSSIINCCIQIFFAGFVLISINWNESQHKDTPFYNKSSYFALFSILQIAICAFGIFAALTEKFINVLIFSILVTVFAVFSVFILFYGSVYHRILTVICMTLLAVISWFFLYHINQRAANENH